MFRKIAIATASACLLLSANGFGFGVADFLSSIQPLTRPAPAAPYVATSARGNFAMAWSAVAEDGSRDIYVWWMDEMGETPTMKVNSATSGDQVAAAIAMDAVGKSVVVWQSPVDGDPGQAQGIYAQRFDALDLPVEPGESLFGERLGEQFRIDGPGAGSAERPDVAMDAHGNFVAAWQRLSGDKVEIAARLFAPDGTPMGREFEVSKRPMTLASRPAVSRAFTGEFVVAWEGCEVTQCDVYTRSFAANGKPDGNPAAVSDVAGQGRSQPAVAMDGHGRFVVVWNNIDQAGTTTIQARQFLAGGAPKAPSFQVNEASDAVAGAPAVAADASGDFIVAWQRAAVGGNPPTWYARLFASDGTPAQAIEAFEAPAIAPRVVMDADGDFTVASTDGADVVALSEYVGPESIDVGIAVTEEQDPVPVGAPVRHTVTVTNHHQVSAETGIAAVDSAIGAVRNFSWSGSISGAERGDLPANCGAGWFAPSYWCSARTLPAGSQLPWQIEPRIAGPGTIQHDVSADGFSYYDPNSQNDNGTVETSVVCPGDNGVGEIVLLTGPQSVTEGATITLEVERSSGTCGPASVRYLFSPSTEAQPSSGTLNWAAGEGGVRQVQVQVRQDSTDENSKTLNASLFSPSGAALRMPAQAAFTIVDDDPTPTMTLSPLSHTVTEGGAAISIIATLSNPTEKQISVPLTVGGTATQNQDYTVTVSSASSRPVQSELIRVTITQDAVDEDDQTVVLTIGEPTNAIMPGGAQVTVVIQDDDAPPAVQVLNTDATVQEGGAPNVLLQLSRGSERPVVVPLQWSGTAGQGSDFLAPSSVTIPAGSMSASVGVSTQRDGLDEDLESAVLTLGSPTNAILGSDINFALSIQDVDPTPSISFATPSQATAEGGGPITITAGLSAASGREVRVSLGTSGDATNPDDYVPSAGEIVIPAGATTGSITVSITDDGAIELTESATFTMATRTNAEAGAFTSHAVTIRDNDPVGLPIP